jgi:hypothetical protein
LAKTPGRCGVDATADAKDMRGEVLRGQVMRQERDSTLTFGYLIEVWRNMHAPDDLSLL